MGPTYTERTEDGVCLSVREKSREMRIPSTASQSHHDLSQLTQTHEHTQEFLSKIIFLTLTIINFALPVTLLVLFLYLSTLHSPCMKCGHDTRVSRDPNLYTPIRPPQPSIPSQLYQQNTQASCSLASPTSRVPRLPSSRR